MSLCENYVPRTIGLPIWTVLLLAFFSSENYAQQKLAHIQPDALGPGMTVAMEMLAPAADSGAFGKDGIYLPESKIYLENPFDTLRVSFGPVVVSWKGRVLQVPVITNPYAVPGTIRFQIIIGNLKSRSTSFEIRQPIPKLSIFGGAILGDNSFAPFSYSGSGSTIVVDEIDFQGNSMFDRGFYRFFTDDDDPIFAGNPHYHPVTILSRGAIRFRNSEISVSADSLNGGPGGGGGGHGWLGTGGAGYSGGGSDSGYSTDNIGTGAASTIFTGGASSTGVLGGKCSDSISDQGGGGGTGCPYGSSGLTSSGNDSSEFGGFGGASAGGESPGIPYGGGGGGFATKGEKGAGFGNNGGKVNGARFLLPMQGGSGGGSGNHVSDKDSTAGSGGGGGGAITIISYDSLYIQGSIISANGKSGTSGISSVDAGGGGGSGGGILLSARNGISINNGAVIATGGNGGHGGLGIEQKSQGGVGGLGLVRMDGDVRITGTLNYFTGVSISGPTLATKAKFQNGAQVVVGGTAGDSAALTDSIRVYYRNRHSGWSFIDTLRFKSNGNYRWEALIPAEHDSTLLVTAMAKIRSPMHTFANYEPDYLMSHLSSGIVAMTASPDLVLSRDTLDFGCFKAGDTCVRAKLHVSNLGEDSLHIHSIVSNNTSFTVTQTLNSLGYYQTDSIEVTYCPSKIGKDTAVLTFNSNDTVKHAVLIGCGIDKDIRIIFKPSTIDFMKVHVGKCDTLSVTAYSIGKDTALVSSNTLSHPPFQIISPTTPKRLGRQDSLKILFSFCPRDTGVAQSSFIFSEKRDSVLLKGLGVLSLLTAQENIFGDTLCSQECDSFRIKFISRGNESVHITGISGASFGSLVLPHTLPPHVDTEYVIYYCGSPQHDSLLVVHYDSDADSSNETVIHYFVQHPKFISDSALHFSQICAPARDSLPFSIARTGNDPITITSIKLKKGIPFSLVGNASPQIDSVHLQLLFTPQSKGEYSDTLIATVHLNGCGDSLVIIPISASAGSSDFIFSNTTLNFGRTDTGLCIFDSVLITNPCSNSEQLLIQPLHSPFALVTNESDSIDFAGDENKILHFSYCPTKVNVDSETVLWTLPSGKQVSIVLHGEGSAHVDSSLVRYKLERILGIAGKEFSYPIVIDTITASVNLRHVTGELNFDPRVVRPMSMSVSNWIVDSGSETTPGTFNFSLRTTSQPIIGSVIAAVNFLGLYGQQDTTSVYLSKVVDLDYSQVKVINGFIKVANCGTLPGNIIVAGDYVLGNPNPNPAIALLSVPITLGVDGALRIRIYNFAGAKEHETLFQLSRGEHNVSVDVSTLPTGMYILSTDSWGWHDAKIFMIQK
ncbi:MAG: choice-of-anchor D domain-containing protein [bacterium]